MNENEKKEVPHSPIDLPFIKTKSLKPKSSIYTKQNIPSQIRLLSEADVQVKNFISDVLQTIEPIDKDSFDIKSKLQEIKIQKEKARANYDTFLMNEKLSDEETWQAFKTMTKPTKHKQLEPQPKKSKFNQLSVILTTNSRHELMSQLDKSLNDKIKEHTLIDAPNLNHSNTQLNSSYVHNLTNTNISMNVDIDNPFNLCFPKKKFLTIDDGGWEHLWKGVSKKHVDNNNNNNSNASNNINMINFNNRLNSKYDKSSASKKQKIKQTSVYLTALDCIKRGNNFYNKNNNTYLHLNTNNLLNQPLVHKKTVEDAYAENLVNDLFFRPLTSTKGPLTMKRKNSLLNSTQVISNKLELSTKYMNNANTKMSLIGNNNVTMSINPFHTLCSEIHSKILTNMNISDNYHEKQKELKQTILEFKDIETSELNSSPQNVLSKQTSLNTSKNRVCSLEEDDTSLLSEDNELRNRKLFKRYKLIYDSLSDEENDLEFDLDESHYIRPHSHMKNMIESLVCIMTLIYLIIIPIQIAYIHEMVNNILPFVIINLIGDCIYLVDFISCFFTAYLDYEDQLIVSKQLIALNYLQGWFLMDLIALFPTSSVIDIMIYIKPTSTIATIAKQIFVHSEYNYIHFLKLIKFIKMAKVVFNNYLMKFVVNHMFVAKQGRKLLLYLTLLVFAISVHGLCCMFIFLGFNHYPSWILQQQIQPVNGVEIYIASLHYVLYTVFGVGYGDILATNSNEKLFTLCLLQIGVITYSWLVSSLGKIKNDEIMSIQAEKKEEYEKRLELLDFIRVNSQSLNHHFYHKVQRYLHYQYLKELYNPNVILDILPSTLKKQLIFAMYRPIIKNFILFKTCTNEDFIMKVLTCFRPGVSLKNERILNRGDYIEEMIFVKIGKLAIELLLPSNISTLVNKAKMLNRIHLHLNTQNKTLTPQGSFIQHNTSVSEELFNNQYIKLIEIRKNEHFGDIGMFCNQRSPLSVRVTTSKAELLYLRKADAIEIAMSFPKIWRRILVNSLYNVNQINILIQKVIDYFAESDKSLIGFVKDNNDLFFVETSKGLAMIKKENNKEEEEHVEPKNNSNNNNGIKSCFKKSSNKKTNNKINIVNMNHNDNKPQSQNVHNKKVDNEKNDHSSLISNSTSHEQSDTDSLFSNHMNNNNSSFSDISNVPLIPTNDEIHLQQLEHRSSCNLRKLQKNSSILNIKQSELMFKHHQSEQNLKALFGHKWKGGMHITHFCFSIIKSKHNKKTTSYLISIHRNDNDNQSNIFLHNGDCSTQRDKDNTSISICPMLYNEIMNTRDRDYINNELYINEQLVSNPKKQFLEYHKAHLYNGNSNSYDVHSEEENENNNFYIDNSQVSVNSSRVPLNKSNMMKRKSYFPNINYQYDYSKCKFNGKDLVIDTNVMQVNIHKNKKGKIVYSLTNKIYSPKRGHSHFNNKSTIKKNNTGIMTGLINNNSSHSVKRLNLKSKKSAKDFRIKNDKFGLLNLQKPNSGNNGFIVKDTDNKRLQRIQNNIENNSLNLTNPQKFYSRTFLHMINFEGKDKSGKMKGIVSKHFDSKLKMFQNEKDKNIEM